MFFGDRPFLNLGAVLDDNLGMCLVKHVLDKLLVGIDGHNARPGLLPRLASVEILHVEPMCSQ